MGLEIERRFLVKSEGWKVLVDNAQKLRQGYIATSKKGWTVRLRILAKEKAWLTMKAKAKGITNYEFEYLIPLSDAETIWSLLTSKFSKTRFELNVNGKKWVVDCFEEANPPLLIAEVEMTSSKEIIQIPEWCGEEITGDYQWSNASLAQAPLNTWSTQNRFKNQKGPKR